MVILFLYSLCWSCFFFKQKTAYELRISDWSSDVCSSDLDVGSNVRNGLAIRRLWPVFDPAGSARSVETVRLLGRGAQSRATIGISCPCARCTALYKLGRASCRERVCQ